MAIPDISAMMKEEGFKASERTIWNDLHSIEAKDYQEEILRKQLTDITIAEIGLRLKYRGKLLDKLLPVKVEQKVSGELKQEIKLPDVDVKGLIERAIPAIIENFMDAEAKQLHGAISPTDESPDGDDPEGLDTAQPDG